MTSRTWTFRTAASAVALAAAATAFSTFAVAQADEGTPTASVERHDPAEHTHAEHDLDGPMSRT